MHSKSILFGLGAIGGLVLAGGAAAQALPGVTGQVRPGNPPLTNAWSVPHTPQACTAMRT